MVLGTLLFPTVVVGATFSSTYDAVLKGLEWREQQGSNVAMLLKYRDHETPDFALTALFGDVAMVRWNGEFLEANNLGEFGDPDAIPEVAKTMRSRRRVGSRMWRVSTIQGCAHAGMVGSS